MLRQNLLIGALVAVGLTCGCEKKERSVDISPARPSEPVTESPTPVHRDETARADQAARNAEVREEKREDNVDTHADKVDETAAAHGTVKPRAAVMLITASRCSREAVCNNIGAKHKYATMAECKTKLSDEKSDDLNFKDCPRGIDKKELDECLTAIKKEDCNNPLDSLSRLAACRSSDLCLSK